jgi:cell division protein FtsQ
MIADRARRRRFLPRARVRVPGPRGLAAIVVVLAVLVGAFFWVRQSSLVAIQEVTINGVAGPDATQIRTALRESAETMTTMAVSESTLKRAVARYPVVRDLTVSTHFPHGLSIDVSEEVPVAVIAADGTLTEVSANGTLLRKASASASLPTISAALAPTGSQVTGAARREVALLADAPYALLAKIATAGSRRTLGLMVTLRDGPAIYFGGAAQLRQKWRAATLALAAPDSAGADYIDVTDPNRPAAGTGSDGASSPSSGTAASSATVTTGDTGQVATTTATQ